MNRIDKLLIRAREAARGGLELLPSLVIRDGHFWTAEVHLGDGHAHTVKRATYATEGAAVEHIRAMAERHPNSQDVPIIVIDV